MRNNFKLSENFLLSEFESHDTGEVIVDDQLIDKLEHLRALVGKPITIIDGYRTPEHNAAVGGEPDSQHMKGTAADITWNGFDMDEAAALAEAVGFDGIGKYPGQGFIHVDVRGVKARWLRLPDGTYTGWA